MNHMANQYGEYTGPYHHRSRFVIVVLLVFVALLIYGYVTTQPAREGVNENDQSAASDALQDALSSSDPQQCLTLSGDQRTNCLIMLTGQRAIDASDPAMCDTYPDVAAACRDYYNTRRAAAGNGSCDDVQDHDQCYLQAALLQNEPGYCERITSPDMRQNCMTAVSQQP